MVNILFTLMMFSALFACTFFSFKRFTRTETSPKSAHNRSISWYQNIMNMPAELRAEQLEEWSKYTEELPTEKPVKSVN